MTSRTAIVALPVSGAEAFAYLADVENLPEWATEFARELKVVEGKHKVVNGLGEFFFEIRTDEGTGVIDMYAGPTEDALALFPTRVVSLGERQSAYVFTMFQQPGQPDEQFEGQYESLQRELAIVARRFGG
jgi:hypothetical protein